MSETTVRQALPERPYKFLDYFEAADRPIFFGRDKEVNHLVQHIMAHRLTVRLWRNSAASGSQE